MSSLMKSGGSLPDPNQKATYRGDGTGAKQTRISKTSGMRNPGDISGLYKAIHETVEKYSEKCGQDEYTIKAPVNPVGIQRQQNITEFFNENG